MSTDACDVCGNDACTYTLCDECDGTTAGQREVTGLRTALADERAISAAAIRERDELVKALSSIRDEFDSTVIEAERSKGGMSVPFGGDFAAVVRLPSVTARMKWWVQQFDAALARAKAGAR